MKLEACEDRQRLQKALDTIQRDYQMALETLSRAPQLPERIHHTILSYMDELHPKLDAARQALEEHVKEHGC